MNTYISRVDLLDKNLAQIVTSPDLPVSFSSMFVLTTLGGALAPFAVNMIALPKAFFPPLVHAEPAIGGMC